MYQALKWLGVVSFSQAGRSGTTRIQVLKAVNRYLKGLKPPTGYPPAMAMAPTQPQWNGYNASSGEYHPGSESQMRLSQSFD